MRSNRHNPVKIVEFVALASMITANVAAELPDSVYLSARAIEARDVAEKSCKPLVVHVVPNSRVGMQQVVAFYSSMGGLPPDLLEQVVIVILPRDRYAGFAAGLGINDAGGMRTISAYNLGALDAKSVTTCRAGFI